MKKSSSKLKETLKKKKAEMTDADAALLATTRKQGNHLMVSQKKIKYVSKVYNLFELRNEYESRIWKKIRKVRQCLIDTQGPDNLVPGPIGSGL